MSSDHKDLENKLSLLIKKRDKLNGEVERGKGRFEEAQKRLKSLEDKCLEKKIDPKDLPKVVEKLEKEFESSLEKISNELDGVEAKLKELNLS